MKKLLLLAFLGCSFNASAWNLKGHVLIAQIAYDNMNPHVRVEVNDLVGRIYSQLPHWQRRFMDRQFGGVSTYAKVASLPDSWRSLPLKKLFKRFQSPLGSLAAYARDKTFNWHFINKAYPYTYCNLIKKENVTWALPMLQKAFREEKNPNTKAMILIFISHFVADVHQPLHTVTRVNVFCQGDAGGNAYCLQTQNGQCVLNLHALWDGALGYLWHTKNLMRAADQLQHEFPEAQFASQLQSLSSASWVQDEYKDAKFIYSTSENQRPGNTYYAKGQQIAKRQIMLAAYRLAKIVDNIYE